jgi:AraC-like DNA-binding protein
LQRYAAHLPVVLLQMVNVVIPICNTAPQYVLPVEIGPHDAGVGLVMSRICRLERLGTPPIRASGWPGHAVLSMYVIRSIRAGVERLPAGYNCPRHQHVDSSVTVVLEGTFEQAGYFGRIVVGPGDVLLQPTLDCHADRMLSAGLRLLRIPWEWESSYGGVFRNADPDAICTAASRDYVETKHLLKQLFEGTTPVSAPASDWEDLLAARIKSDSSTRIDEFAQQVQKSRETVYRGFMQMYGVSPSGFRGEIRARKAWVRVTDTADSLTNIAIDTGFSDQPHMTRDVKRLTGRTPADWRRQIAAQSERAYKRVSMPREDMS